MVPNRLKLSCSIQVDNDSINNEELFWKTCTWTRLSDNSDCLLYAVNNYDIEKRSCDSSMGEVNIDDGTDGKFNRLECSISIPISKIEKNIVDEAWKCTLHKCKDMKDGGCNAKDEDECSNDVTVNATVNNYIYLTHIFSE